jgi:hypothetical protein
MMKRILWFFLLFCITLPVLAQYPQAIVGSPTFGVAKFNDGLIGTSDSNYLTLPSGVFPSSPSVTWEAWLKTTGSGGVQVALTSSIGGSDGLWMGMWTDGNFAFAETTWALDSGIRINDGNWHHCVGVFTPTTMYTFVDGVAGTTHALAFKTPASTGMAMGRYQVNSYPWNGSIDEVAIWNFQKYTAPYTVPTAPYTGSETGLWALYHLDASGAGSVPPPVTINPTNASIIYSPFNWSVSSGYARTINSGAYFRTIFSGTSVALTTDTSPDAAPYSQIWVRVDNGAWQLFTLSAGNPTLSVATGLSGGQKHMLEVVVKATSEFLTRWSSPQTIVQITGIVLDTGAAVTVPNRRTKNVLIFGDSITEGYHVFGLGDVTTSDVLGCYSYALATALDAEVGVVAFGGTGILNSGQGGVPALPSSYAYLYSGVSRSFTSPAPDLVIYNEGTNDTGSIASGFETVIEGILASAPNSKHLILVPFNQTHVSDIQAAAAGIGSANVTYHGTSAWFNASDSVDGLHPYAYSSVDFIAPQLLPIVEGVLY